MIECPFCGEALDEEELVYEFHWGEVATFLYNRKSWTRNPGATWRTGASM